MSSTTVLTTAPPEAFTEIATAAALSLSGSSAMTYASWSPKPKWKLSSFPPTLSSAS